MKSKICEHCKSRFTPSRTSQKYCIEQSCRRSRKREWQKCKLETDPDYKAAQREAHARWKVKNPDYYRIYRKKNSGYANRNRRLQRIRNKKRSKQPVSVEIIGKMDTKVPVITGFYQLLPLEKDGKMIAKMESKYVQLTLL